MSSRPSFQDEETPPNNKNNASSFCTAVYGDEAIALDEATFTDTAATGGTGASAKINKPSQPSQLTKLTLTKIDLSVAHPAESFTISNSGNRSSDQRPKILDLPNEIIDNIMFHLSGRPHEYDSCDRIRHFLSTSKQDIKNARLSCRILSANASRYLVDHIRFYVSLSSLSRLDKVCDHPDIRHGVQVVEICLAQYDDSFDGGVQGLIRFIRHFSHHLDLRWLSADEVHDTALNMSYSWGNYLEALESRDHTLLGSFDEELNFIRSLNESGFPYMRALLEGYYLYRSGLQEQAQDLQNGSFVARVSALMEKLPAAKHFKLTDSGRDRWGRQHCLNISTMDSIVESLAQYRSSFQEVQGNTLLHLIPSLIGTGTGIKSLNIQISASLHSYTTLLLPSPQEALLRSSLKKLRSFKLEHYATTSYPWRDRLGFRSLARFLDACLGSEDLERLFINARIHGSSPEGSLISPRPWPKLKHADLSYFPASRSDLDVLTRSLASKIEGSLRLIYVHLYCGATWASVLDMLRDRHIDASLTPQSGAEFDTSPVITAKIFHRGYRLFAFPVYYPSFAGYYIRGEDMPNPIRHPPDQELRDRLYGLVPDN